MTDNRKRTVEPPSYLREHLPSPEQLKACLTNEPFAVGGEAPLYRAACLPENVLPTSVARAYRFGPPAEVHVGGTGTPAAGVPATGTPAAGVPFWRLYASHVAETAIWEAQFCRNDVTRPGTFYMDPFAVQHGIIAKLSFSRPLRFWSFTGSVASRLGIYDEISSPDYAWCQWFGYYVDVAMQSVDETMRPDGFVYPSRRHRGHTAVAISSRVLPALRERVARSDTPFVKHPDFKRLLDDRLRVAPPVADASADGQG